MIRRGALQSIVDTRLILSIDHIILVKAPLKMLPHEGSTTRYVSPLVVVREENHRTARQPSTRPRQEVPGNRDLIFV